MARIDSILSLDRRDIEALWLAMYGYLNFPAPAPARTRIYLGLLDGATAQEYLAIQDGVAAIGGELVIPPTHLREGLLESAELGSIGGIVVADPLAHPPIARSVSLNSTEGAPLAVIAHLYPFFVNRGSVNGVRVLCDDASVRTWFEATGELPISVIHSGHDEIDPEFRAALHAEGQAGRYRKVTRSRPRCDIDTRTAPEHRYLAAAVSAALEFSAS